MIYFIYLAAGNSSRFGKDNKLLHNYDGCAIFRHTLDKLCSACKHHSHTDIIVVTKHSEILSYTKDMGITTVYEPEMPNQISYTIKAGIHAIKQLNDEDFLVFVVADQPLLSANTLEKFISIAKTDVLTASAFYGDTRGNPTMFSAKLAPQLLSLRGDVGGKVILSKYPPARIPVDNKLELVDIDTIDELHQLQQNK